MSSKSIPRIFPEERLFVPYAAGACGYYPGALSECLANRYRIVRKLGWSTYCNVWLCCDISSPNPRYVAVKIQCVRDETDILEGKSEEADVLRLLAVNRETHPGSQYSLACYDQFTITSPLGAHQCFVTEVLGSSIRSLQQSQPNHIFPLPVIKRITKQILLAMDYLHRGCKFIHGDMKSSNILVAISAQPNTITSYLKSHPSLTYEPLDYPELSPQPIVPVKSQPLPNFGLDESNLSHLNVKVIDYGEALPINHFEIPDYVRFSIQPAMNRAPEVMIGSHYYGAAIDIWSIGCLIFEFATASLLFGQPRVQGKRHHARTHLQRISELFGAFPETALAEGPSGMRAFFDEKGFCRQVAPYWNTTLENILAERNPNLAPREVAEMGAFMRCCFVIDRTKRPTAQQLLTHPWLQDA